MVALINQCGCKTQVPFPTMLCFYFLNKYLSLICVPIPIGYTSPPLQLSLYRKLGLRSCHMQKCSEILNSSTPLPEQKTIPLSSPFSFSSITTTHHPWALRHSLRLAEEVSLPTFRFQRPPPMLMMPRLLYQVTCLLIPNCHTVLLEGFLSVPSGFSCVQPRLEMPSLRRQWSCLLMIREINAILYCRGFQLKTSREK